jgi:3-hydroxyacyl-[acyl-carrier-protein] dehydratase
MQYTFVDRVLELEPGVKITTVKCLSLAEEYLADHFPRFPVMPGVLMVQSMTDAAALLIAASEDFAHSMITLKEARNVRFAGFVQPGRTLRVTAEIVKFHDREVELKTQGSVEGRTTVNGRLLLDRYNLADERPEMVDVDAYLKQQYRARLARLYQPDEAMAGPHAPDRVGQA